MYKSIRTQFIQSYISFITILVVLIIGSNLFLLEPFYIHQKLSKLEMATNQFEAYWKKEDRDKLLNLINELENVDSVRIDFRDENGQTLYNTKTDVEQGEKMPPMGFLQKQRFELFLSPEDLEKLSDGEIVTFNSNQKNDVVQLIGAAKEIDRHNLLIMQIPAASIKESVSLINRFILVISLLLFIFGWIWSKIFANRFTRPILQLKEMSESIAEQDFSKKWADTRQDELGDLGKTMNELSTILDLSIEEIKIKNSKLEDEIKRKDQLENLRKEFISDVSHELKTPIALIQGYAEGLLLNIHRNTESKDEYCQVILDESRKMSNLVSDLLMLSKLDAGYEELHYECFDIKELVNQVIKKLEKLDESSVQVMNHANSIKTYGDKRKVEQILTNYLTNAYKHVDESGLVRIKTERKADNLRISVFNTGMGLPLEELDNIWESFYKLDKSRTHKSKISSSGLGLSIVRKLVTVHKGTCGVQNVEGGIEFWFEIPLP